MKENFLNYIRYKNEALKFVKEPIIGWVCTYTPEEIIIAAGFHPYRILPHTDPSLANSYLDSNFCPYVRSCLGEALDKRLIYLKNIVVVNSCDAMRRLYDAWRYYLPSSFIYLLDLPRKNSGGAIQYYQHNFQSLINELEDRFKIRISKDLLYQAISVCNKTRKLLGELFNLYVDNQISLSSVDLFRIVEASMVLPKEHYNELLEEFVKDVKRKENILPDSYKNSYKIRNEFKILITGTIMDDLSMQGVVEDYGGKVAFVDMCTGNRYFQSQIQIQEPEKTNINPIRFLAEYYLNKIPCPRMMDLEKRWTYLLNIIRDYQIEGVIFYNLKFCDTALFELPIIRKRLQKYRIPSLCLEGDYTSVASGRIKTRIQAFLEVLEFAG